jgi:hypothetical protein
VLVVLLLILKPRMHLLLRHLLLTLRSLPLVAKEHPFRLNKTKRKLRSKRKRGKNAK